MTASVTCGSAMSAEAEEALDLDPHRVETIDGRGDREQHKDGQGVERRLAPLIHELVIETPVGDEVYLFHPEAHFAFEGHRPGQTLRASAPNSEISSCLVGEAVAIRKPIAFRSCGARRISNGVGSFERRMGSISV